MLGLISTTNASYTFSVSDIHFDVVEELNSKKVVVSNCTVSTTGTTGETTGTTGTTGETTGETTGAGSTTGTTETTSGTGTTTASTTFAGTTSKPSDITDVSYAIRQNPVIVFVIAVVFMIFM